jgi:hypothetical protein
MTHLKTLLFTTAMLVCAFPAYSAEDDAATAARKKIQQDRVEVEVACGKAIEKVVKFGIRYEAVMFGLIHLPNFEYGTKNPLPNGHKIIGGDNAEAQNEMGNWVRVHFKCEYDPETKQVFNATVEPGKMPQ